MKNEQILKLTSPMCPTNNHYMNYRVAKKGSYSFIQAYKPAETIKYERDFKKIIEKALEEQHWETPTKDTFIYMDCDFYFHKKGIDPNNCYKVPCDVLTSKGVWLDDDMVLNRSQRVYFDSKNPRIEITISIAPYIGIFDNLEHFNKFLSENCNKCTKGGANTRCSILRKAKESRILEEINIQNLICIKKKIKK